jgi:1-deoxy-D-xylulose-5-phosphate reductoisomerase
MKGVSILGSTGSIGAQTLDIARLHPKRFKVTALAAGSNVELLERQAREFRPAIVSAATQVAARELQTRLCDLSPQPWIGYGAEGLEKAATAESAQVVVGGLPGSAGLAPTFAAVNAGKDIALATKEVLVMAGDLFMDAVRNKGICLLPVDSEQSAIFQCMPGGRRVDLKRILLTGSGGPFRDMPAEQLDQVTVEQALNHPRWKMGPKVTIDSATLMNKGLEVIEARWLFDVPASKIEVVIHPECICHSMVEFMDGSIIAQLGATDMRIPISYALAYPERIESGTPSLSFPQLGRLTFAEPDTTKFPLLRAAFDALEAGGSAPLVLNAADEVAVELFLQRKISFGRISRMVLDCMDRVGHEAAGSLEDVVGLHHEVVSRIRRDWEAYGRGDRVGD